MKYLSAAASYSHLSPARTAVLLVNLGTPRAPTAGEVRRYLNEFLFDPRVVEIPRPIWWLILRAIILPFRSSASAARYASVWGPDGSPLLANSERQQSALIAELKLRDIDVDVVLAMRYGDPSIPFALERLRREGATRLLVLPMYPQYSATTSASAFDSVAAVLQRSRNLPELRWIRGFHDDPGYIDALRSSVLDYWSRHGRPDRLVMSFHGLPRRNLDQGDPYHCECHKTGRLLAEALGLGKDEYAVTFQSRFGRARWLEPYTADTLRALARAGVRRVDVVCPGFPADCLETLEEIGLEARADFLSNGGGEFHLIECLNAAPRFISALADLVQSHIQGWPVRSEDQVRAAKMAQSTAERARAMGAVR
jgi:ferrochelatase